MCKDQTTQKNHAASCHLSRLTSYRTTTSIIIRLDTYSFSMCQLNVELQLMVENYNKMKYRLCKRRSYYSPSLLRYFFPYQKSCCRNGCIRNSIRLQTLRNSCLNDLKFSYINCVYIGSVSRASYVFESFVARARWKSQHVISGLWNLCSQPQFDDTRLAITRFQ